MIRAAIDPGSRWIAVTITRDDGPASPCTFLDAKCFDVPRVDHLVTYDPPQQRIKRRREIDGVLVEGPLQAYLVSEERVQSPADVIATDAARLIVGDETAAYLTARGAEACDVETVRHVFAKTAQGAAAAGDAIRVGAEIVAHALALWGAERKSRGLTAPRVLMLAASWRARLSPMVKAANAALDVPREGVLIKASDRGGALEPVLVAHVPGWPGGASFPANHVEHIRDSTGLALACGLPAIAPRKATSGAPRVRKPREPGKAPPRRSRARAAMGPIDLEKARATVRAWAKRTIYTPALEARAAAGCDCRAPGERKTGRHKATCAMHKPRRPVPA